ncbi:response regulator transcription factor [Clostridium tarantellae]|uniref:Stage 0 sporulation protein A homolog n=1 Tax=Clostridium tarantellae TaxID=39493 RepID=A0A6I1MMW9_9CLOT|nr:response regulator transcription factor [Clostridium tarantellae]MPQ44836.1 response regulator [Clostridium tarantellae]
MYKVMLADDENLILQGIFNIIDWDKLGLEVIHLATNGEDALNKFKKEPVDIVITDINMPKITGLELLKEIKNINKKVKFIILSGYDDFSYAKEGIELGVENYILKPVDEEELERTLIKTVNKLKTENEKEKTIFMKNNFLSKLIKGKASKEELDALNDKISLHLNENMYSLAIIRFKERFIDHNVLHNIIDLIKKQSSNSFEIISNLENQIVLINSWSKEMTTKELKEYYNNLKENIIKQLSLDVFISIGDSTKELFNINESYNSAKELNQYVLTLGFNNCVNKNSVCNLENKNINFIKELDELNKVIIEKNLNSVEKYIDSIFDSKRKLTPKQIYDVSVKILFLIDKVANEFKLERPYSGKSLSGEIVSLCEEHSTEDIKALLISEINEVIELMNPTTIKYSPVVQQIISYVNENYYEEVSLKTLAQKYNINTSYLGQVFTKEVGCSFSEYLNKTKNMKAKDLILNTNLKINDIARQVGYLDTSYFYRKFKKYYGVCPSTLRTIKNY